MKINVVFIDGSEVEKEVDERGDLDMAIKKMLVGKLLTAADGTIYNLDHFLRIELLEQNKKQKS